ncbi:MAG: AI-2E family transporter [Bacillota bacterium]|nr:AI-2E family transporter [Bacillota bacterium]
MKSASFKRVILWITYAIVLFFAIYRIEYIISFFTFVLDILKPFIYGFVIAFIVNAPFMYFKEKVFVGIGTKHKAFSKLRMPLAIITSYVIVLGLITLLISVVMPQLINSINQLFTNLPSYASSLSKFINDFTSRFNGFLGFKVNKIDLEKSFASFAAQINGNNNVSDFLIKVGKASVDTLRSVVIFFYNWFLAIVISIYFLISKDQLIQQTKKVACAVLPKRFVKPAFDVARLSNHICGRYIYGRTLDSVIMGLLCFIIMTIFGWPYPVLISVIIGVTNIVPIFGPIIGDVICGFILLMVNPIDCFWFIIFTIILQQIDGNVIAPKILSDSMGMSGFWMMFSVILGGGLFGLAGMVIGVPIFVVIYIILGKKINFKNKLDGYNEDFSNIQAVANAQLAEDEEI